MWPLRPKVCPPQVSKDLQPPEGPQGANQAEGGEILKAVKQVCDKDINKIGDITGSGGVDPSTKKTEHIKEHKENRAHQGAQRKQSTSKSKKQNL